MVFWPEFRISSRHLVVLLTSCVFPVFGVHLTQIMICETRAKVPPNSTNCINEMKSLAKIRLSVMVKCETLAERTATQEKHS